MGTELLKVQKVNTRRKLAIHDVEWRTRDIQQLMIIEVRMLEACYTLLPFNKRAKLYDQDTSISTL